LNHPRDWPTLLAPPAQANDAALADWFQRIAHPILTATRLEVAGEPFRLTEVEFYYFNPAHPDPFSHRQPITLECGRWYFHRSGDSYRGGSFKGLDLTFGDGSSYSGMLIRSLASEADVLIDGPSLCVDHLLKKTKAADVAELDRRVAGRLAWEPGNPLRLVPVEASDETRIFQSARVGLSLKRATDQPNMPRFVLRPYRFLSEPRRISKGKPHLVLALHTQGFDPTAIQEITGCPRITVTRYIAAYEAGRDIRTFQPYFGVDLTPEQLCRLHGTVEGMKNEK
jgi:hypothetical protein